MLVFLQGCNIVSLAMNSSTAYDVYSIAREERGIYSITKDKIIKTTIQAKILDDENLSIFDIGVESFYGRVYLIGEYEKKEQIQTLVNYARQTNGVKKIIYYLMPINSNKNCTSAENLTLRANFKANLLLDKHTKGTNIHIHTVGCKVILTGVVSSKKEAKYIENYAKNAYLSQGVRSYLIVLD